MSRRRTPMVFYLLCLLPIAASCRLVKQEPEPHGQRLEITEGIAIRRPPRWQPAAVRYSNATEIVVLEPVKGTTARTLMTTETRRDHDEAVRRLAEIASERPERGRFIEVCGWPAFERRYRENLPVRGQDRPELGKEQTDWATTAVAVGERVVRLETTLAFEADQNLIDEALAIGRGLVCSARSVPDETRRRLDDLRKTPEPEDERMDALPFDPTPVKFRDEGTPPVGLPVNVQNGIGELEIAVSNNGQNVVIAANPGYSFSTNGGATFTPVAGGTPANFPRDGDPSLAVGASGRFYYGFIGFPNGTPAAGGVTGCSTGISSATPPALGAFAFLNHAVLCPQSGAGLCFPDQEHIAADSQNAAAGGGDRVYSVWRNFTPAGPPPATCGGIGSGFVTPSIVCSSNGGAAWTAPAAIAAGDFPRTAVAPNGTVYVVYASGTNIMVNRYSACDAGLTQQTGFPVTVAAAVPNVVCPLPGLDRCNDGNTLSSHTVAVDDTNSNHVYVAYATNTAVGNENVVVRESTNGGVTWSAPVTVHSAATARRFMPWVCSEGGNAFVSWYDRRAATAANNDRTNFYVATASVEGGALQGGPERNVTGNADPQCASGWPCQPRAMVDSESCSVQPQAAGRCSGSGAPCDFSTPACPAGQNCLIGNGCPKYGDYNGSGCGGGRFYSAWASATAPVGLPAAAGIRVYSSVLAASDFYVRDWTDSPTSGDDGAQPSTHPVFYATSDVWNRRGPSPGTFMNGQPQNEDAGNGAGNIGDNWAFARIRRNSAPTSGDAAVRAHFLVSKLGTGSNYVDAGSGDPDVSSAAPDPVTIFDPGVTGPITTVAYPWHLNAVSSMHLCLAVEISSVGDPFIAPSLLGFAPGWPATDTKILNDNNKAQRNMGLSTTPASGASGSVGFYAIAHNAATFPRDMEIRYRTDPRYLAGFEGARVEVVGEDARAFKQDDVLILRNMMPGENRWLGLTYRPPPGRRGDLALVHFYEIVDGEPVNGFSLGARRGSLDAVIADARRLENSIVRRAGALLGREHTSTLGREGDAVGAIDARRYAAELESRVPALREILDATVGGAKDVFGLREQLEEVRRGEGRTEDVAMAHLTLLNRLDAQLTMRELDDGDVADIPQMVRWQRQLYGSIAALRNLPCARPLVRESGAFVKAYGERRATAVDYPKLIRAHRACYEQSAKALDDRAPGLEATVTRLGEAGPSLAAVQKAHRAMLIELQNVATVPR
ncbi:MAG: hypothetical protein HY699_20185 [Deltaproteobacteria bacterium]|nr:hypothetical protein [Deltaproteobacteria bacterium]